MVGVDLDALEHVAVVLHVVGDLVVAVDAVQIDKDRVAHPMGIEGRVVVHRKLGGHGRAVLGRTCKPAVEAVVVTHGERQIGGLDRGAGVDRKGGHALGALAGVEGDRRGLYPLGVEGKVAGHALGEVIGLGTALVDIPASEAVALAGRLELGRRVIVRNLDLRRTRVGRAVLGGSAIIGRERHQRDERRLTRGLVRALVVRSVIGHGMGLLLPAGSEGDVVRHGSREVIGLPVERPAGELKARPGLSCRIAHDSAFQKILVGSIGAIADIIFVLNVVVGILQSHRVRIGRPLGIKLEVLVRLAVGNRIGGEVELLVVRASYIPVPAAKGVALAARLRRLADRSLGSLVQEPCQVDVNDRQVACARALLRHVEHHAVLRRIDSRPLGPVGYDRRVVRELRGGGHLGVAGVPAVEHIAFARGLGHRGKRLGGVHRHGHRGGAIGQRALARIERHDGARLGVGHRKGHDLVALGVHARGALLGLVRGARAVGVLIAHGL